MAGGRRLPSVVSFAAGDLQECTDQQEGGASRQGRDRQP